MVDVCARVFDSLGWNIKKKNMENKKKKKTDSKNDIKIAK